MTTAIRRLLQVPLDIKLLVPNLAAIAIAAATVMAADRITSTSLEYVAITVLLVGVAINYILVRVALKEVRLRGARIVYAQEHERASVARELHESIGQTLAAASYQAAAAINATAGHPPEPNTLEVARLLRTAMEDLRNVSRDLHPRVADDLGLPAALEGLTRSIMDRSLIEVHLSVKGFTEPVTAAASSTLYRIARETLRSIEANAARGTVTIAISSDQATIQMEINDDCAFDLSARGAIQASLAPMAERLSLLGGELLVESNFRGGTRVFARFRRQREAA